MEGSLLFCIYQAIRQFSHPLSLYSIFYLSMLYNNFKVRTNGKAAEFKKNRNTTTITMQKKKMKVTTKQQFDH